MSSARSNIAVCVLGMGRSGTSITMGVLNLLGVDVGPEDGLIPANPANAKGYWERHAILDVNDGVLSMMGGTYLDPPRLRGRWARHSGLDVVRRRAAEIVEGTFGASEVWGFKDPRMCLTLPFWRALVPNLRHVICIRHPAEVAASLSTFAGHERLDNEQCDRLWLRSLAQALTGTRGDERLLLLFDGFFTDLDAQLERLARFIDRPLTNPVRDAAAEFVGHGLRHHWVNASTARGASVAALELYEALAAATRGDEAALRVAQRMARRFSRSAERPPPLPRRAVVPGPGAVRMFGIYADGWLRQEACFALDGHRRGRLAVALDVAPCDEQALEIVVNRKRGWHGPVGAGPLELRLDIRGLSKTWHVEFRWAKAVKLATPDSRRASALLRSAAVEPWSSARQAHPAKVVLAPKV